MKMAPLILGLLMLTACSSVQKIEEPEKKAINLQPASFQFKNDFGFSLPEPKLASPKLTVRTFRPADNDYIKRFEKEISVLAYLNYNSVQIPEHMYIQLLHYLQGSLSSKYKVKLIKSSFAYGRVRERKQLEKRLLKEVQGSKPRLLLALKVAEYNNSTSELNVEGSLIDPVYLNQLEKFTASYTVTESSSLRGGLIAIVKSGKRMKAASQSVNRHLLKSEQKLSKPLVKSLQCKFSVLAQKSTVRVQLKSKNKTYNFASLPALDQKVIADTYQLKAERPGFADQTTTIQLRAGKEVTVNLRYPDDTSQNPVGLYSVPGGLLLYENQSKFAGFTPRIYDKPLKAAQKFRLIERRVEEKKPAFFDVGNVNYDGRGDTVVIWREHFLEGNGLLSDDSFWRTSGTLKAFQEAVQADKDSFNALLFKENGSFHAVSARLDGALINLAAQFSKLEGNVRFGLTNQKSFIFFEAQKGFIRVVEQGKPVSDWFEPKDKKVISLGLLIDSKEKVISFKLNGSDLFEKKGATTSNWQLFMFIEHQNKRQNTQLNGISWKSSKDKWLGIF